MTFFKDFKCPLCGDNTMGAMATVHFALPKELRRVCCNVKCDWSAPLENRRVENVVVEVERRKK